MNRISRSDWLPERARWCYLAPSGLPAVFRKKNFPESHVINPLLTKIARLRWLDIGFVLFFGNFMDFNIQPSWSHAWSITPIERSSIRMTQIGLHCARNTSRSRNSLSLFKAFGIDENKRIKTSNLLVLLLTESSKNEEPLMQSNGWVNVVFRFFTAGRVQPARVEFAAPKCAVLESDKLVRIGVKRTGNTKITASVK